MGPVGKILGDELQHKHTYMVEGHLGHPETEQTHERKENLIKDNVMLREQFQPGIVLTTCVVAFTGDAGV